MYIILVTIANWTYAKEDFYEIIKFMPIQEILFTFDSNAFNAIQCNSCNQQQSYLLMKKQKCL